MRTAQFTDGIVIICLIYGTYRAAMNIAHGNAPRPAAFVIVFVGLALFAVAKLSVPGWKKVTSVGPGLLSPRMAELYRVGYWLMAVGILATFA